MKHQLRDENRNKTFHKIVLNRREGSETLVGESDDFIVSYVSSGSGNFLWYVKQRKQALDPFAQIYKRWIDTWPPVDSEQYNSEIQTMLNKLDILRTVLSSALN